MKTFMAKHTDVPLVQKKDVLDATWNRARAVNIPVMTDVDTGGGNALTAAGPTERLTAIGVAGMNIDEGKDFAARWQRSFSNLTARSII